MKIGRPSTRKRTPFGERLYVLRMAAKLSQGQMAERLGLTDKAYSWWERRNVALRPDQIEKLLVLLNVTGDELFPRPDSPSTPKARKRPKSKTK